MAIQKGKTYKFFVQVGSKVLKFTGTVISIDEHFVSFTDKFDAVLNYNLNNIISWELENE